MNNIPDFINNYYTNFKDKIPFLDKDQELVIWSNK